MTDKAFGEFIAAFNYEKITKNEDSVSKWLKNMKTSYFNSLKESHFNLDGKFVVKSQTE